MCFPHCGQILMNNTFLMDNGVQNPKSLHYLRLPIFKIHRILVVRLKSEDLEVRASIVEAHVH